MKLAEKILKDIDEVSMKDAEKKHDKWAKKEAMKIAEKKDLFGAINSMIAAMAKRDKLDIAELDEFDIEPYEIIARDALSKAVLNVN